MIVTKSSIEELARTSGKQFLQIDEIFLGILSDEVSSKIIKLEEWRNGRRTHKATVYELEFPLVEENLNKLGADIGVIALSGRTSVVGFRIYSVVPGNDDEPSRLLATRHALFALYEVTPYRTNQ